MVALICLSLSRHAFEGSAVTGGYCYISVTMSTWSPSPTIIIITPIRDATVVYHIINPLWLLGHFPKSIPELLRGHCYYFYYSTLYFILSLTIICDALITSMFAIVYIYPYRTQSPIIALFSCLHRTLAVCKLILFTRYCTRAFCHMSTTCHITPSWWSSHHHSYIHWRYHICFIWFCCQLTLPSRNLLPTSNCAI